MNKDFRSYLEAVSYSREKRMEGYASIVQEFCDENGIVYTVLVWEKENRK